LRVVFGHLCKPMCKPKIGINPSAKAVFIHIPIVILKS
jgi:hypothetical protein